MSALRPRQLHGQDLHRLAALVRELQQLGARAFDDDQSLHQLVQITTRLAALPSEIVMLGTGATAEQVGAAGFEATSEAMAAVLEANGPALRALLGWSATEGRA